VYLDTTYPLSPEPLERIVVAQDTGGAVRGAVRADFFWGTGPEAGVLAGRMRQPGRFWLLWPRGEPLPPRLGAASR
jgi:membrane-bound lytic murein transglycosylase A